MTVDAVVAARARSLPQLVNVLDARLQLGLAILAGALLRFWHLRGLPPGLNQDEAVYGYDAYSIFMTGRDHLGHPFPFASLETFGDWSSPLLTYLSIPAVAIFGLHVEVLRAVSALVGVAAVPLVYLLAQRLFRRNDAALAAAWIIALSPSAVHLSRWAIIPTVVPTMVAATILAFVWSIETNNRRGIVGAAVLAGLTVAAYHSMKAYVPLLCAATVLVYWRQYLRLKLEPVLYAVIVFSVIAGPILYLTLRDPGGGARLAQTSVLHDHALTLGLLVRQYLGYFSPRFWFVSGDGDPMHLPPGEGLVLKILAPFLIAGLLWLANQVLRGGTAEARRGSIFLLLCLLLYPVPGMMTLPSPHVLRAIHVLPLAALIGGIGIAVAADFVRARRRRFDQRLSNPIALGLALLCIVASSVELVPRYEAYFGRYQDQVARQFHVGMEDALAYVNHPGRRDDEVWVRNMNSAYIYVLFYNRWDPNDVHSDLVVRRRPPDWDEVQSIGRYRFGDPPDFQPGGVVYSSRYRNGEIAYDVVEGTSTGQPVLVVQEHEP